MTQGEILEGNKLIAEFMGLPAKNTYRETGKVDDNGVPILEGSIIIGNGYGADDESFYCVVWDDEEGVFGSCIYRDFEPLSWYDKSIVVKGHCEDFRHLLETETWSGNLSGALKDTIINSFNSSWDCLMPVVEKIEGLTHLGFSIIVNISGCGACIAINPTNAGGNKYEGKRDIANTLNINYFAVLQEMEVGKKEGVYVAVLRFIKWYNSQPK